MTCVKTGKEVDLFRLERKAPQMYKYTFYYTEKEVTEKVMAYRWNEFLTEKQAIKEFCGRQNMSDSKGMSVKISKCRKV